MVCYYTRKDNCLLDNTFLQVIPISAEELKKYYSIWRKLQLKPKTRKFLLESYEKLGEAMPFQRSWFNSKNISNMSNAEALILMKFIVKGDLSTKGIYFLSPFLFLYSPYVFSCYRCLHFQPKEAPTCIGLHL